MPTPNRQRAPLFDARGNRYIVVDPRDVPGLGGLAADPASAAATHARWAPQAIAAFCRRDAGHRGPGDVHTKRFWSDGLLVGPFRCDAGIGLVIVNTDATLAERSGNGLTIFAYALIGRGLVDAAAPFDVAVFHPNAPSDPLIATCRAAVLGAASGVWVDMGTPAFGPSAAGANSAALEQGDDGANGAVCVRALERIDPAWTRSVFVEVGNPHCVTFVVGDLPSMEALNSEVVLTPLQAIANSTRSNERPGTGEVCDLGVNLQWAKVVSDHEVLARVCERGEGPTLSSGSSAVAVASASRHLGLVGVDQILVTTPGGAAPVRFGEDGRVHLFGEAAECGYGVASASG